MLNSIAGRQFPYDRALELIQNEEYLQDSDIDELRRYDVNHFYKRSAEFNEEFNIPKSRQYSNWAPAVDNQNIDSDEKYSQYKQNKEYNGKFSLYHGKSRMKRSRNYNEDTSFEINSVSLLICLTR